MADAIDYDTIRPAISKWVRETSGLQIVWRFRGGVAPAPPYVELSLHGPRQVGDAWRKVDAAPDSQLDDDGVPMDLRVRVRAHEMIRLEVQCFAAAKSGEDAERILGNVMRGLALYEYALDVAGIGIGAATEVQYISGGDSGILEPRAVASVWLHVGSEVEGRLGSIDRAEVTVDVKDAAGEDLLEHTDWMPTENAFDLGFSTGFEV